MTGFPDVISNSVLKSKYIVEYGEYPSSFAAASVLDDGYVYNSSSVVNISETPSSFSNFFAAASRASMLSLKKRVRVVPHGRSSFLTSRQSYNKNVNKTTVVTDTDEDKEKKLYHDGDRRDGSSSGSLETPSSNPVYTYYIRWFHMYLR